MGDTSIEWTSKTWNPVRGCSVVSEGCRNCYAMQVAARFSGNDPKTGKPLAYHGLAYRNTSGAHWTGKVRLVEEHLEDPLRWKRPRRIFVNSMSDLFHESIPDEWIDRIFAVMMMAPHHTFQILTKRPERMRRYFSTSAVVWEAVKIGAPDDIVGERNDDVMNAAFEMWSPGKGTGRFSDFQLLEFQDAWPLPNVWLGVSVEDQKTADERIPLLLQTPAAVRWLSVEPLLGPVNLEKWLCSCRVKCKQNDGSITCSPDGYVDWVVVGGESGPRARRCAAPWVRSVVKQCQTASVPVFVKQLGAFVIDRNDAGFDGCDEDSWPVEIEQRDAIEDNINGYREEWQGADVRVRLLNRKGGDPSEWPEDLRVREFPTVEAVA